MSDNAKTSAGDNVTTATAGQEASDTPRLRPLSDAQKGLNEVLREIGNAPYDDGFVDEDTINSAPVVRLANGIIMFAIEKRASELQLEIDRRSIRFRARIDGRLQQLLMIPKHLGTPILNRFKLMADIAFWRPAPQNGLIRFKIDKQDYNIQVRTIAASHGDQMTLHIVEKSRALVGLRRLPMGLVTQAMVEEAIVRNGLLLIVGPSDSGKTTTAYTLLNRLNDIESTVATWEDLPSYTLSGLVQTYRGQGNASVQKTVDTLIQQNTNVLFCGDLTDADTAEAALTAAENGLLTIACVTAPSVLGAVARLLRFGITADRLADSLSGVLLQALVGLICPDCREAARFDQEQQARLGVLFGGRSASAYPTPPLPFLDTETYRGVGCDACAKTGVRGRMGVFGYGDFDHEARQLLRTGSVPALAPTWFVVAPMQYLEEAARDALSEGKVSPDEIERVLRPLVASARRMV